MADQNTLKCAFWRHDTVILDPQLMTSECLINSNEESSSDEYTGAGESADSDA